MSLLLDEWCRRSAVNRSDPTAYATIARIVALREAGKTIEEVGSEIISETASEAEDIENGKQMQKFDLVDSRTASAYPGHVIVVAGDDVRTTGKLVIKGQPHQSEAEPLETAIHHALLVRQRDALPIAVQDDLGLWPSRLGHLALWPPNGACRRHRDT
ncbi:hypothetical protein [Rhizobium sp. BK251]|uniref:hypothetical protein n=1 Tax=Rhizobium sp. BK251 TaxID=2512125 RepID=UPI001A9EAC2D|nr:hypothetical protein [Rhizobium sp. BK251]